MNSLDANAPNQQHSQLFSGLILLISVLMVAVNFYWFSHPSGAFIVQGPLLLFSVGVGMLAGLVYLPRPHSWVGPIVVGIVFVSLEFSIGDSRGMAQTLVKGMIGMSLMIFSLFQSRRLFDHPALVLFFGYGVTCLASVLYSKTVALTAGAGIAVLGVCFMAAVAADTDGKGLLRYWQGLYWVAVLACLSSFGLLAVAKNLATDFSNAMGTFRFAGIFGSANILGPTMAAGMMVTLLMIKRAGSRKALLFHWLMLLAMTAALLLTVSRTAIVGTIGAVIVAGILRGALGLMAVLSMMVGGVIILFLLLQPEVAHYVMSELGYVFARSGRFEELTSFTGRTDIWAASVRLWLEQPWFGFGLGSTRVELPRLYSNQWGIPQMSTHNFVLEALTNVGLVGTSLLVGSMGLVMWRLSRFVISYREQPMRKFSMDAIRDIDMAVCAARMLVFVTISGLMEKGLAGTPSGATVVLGLSVGTCAYLAFKYKTQASLPVRFILPDPPLRHAQ